MNHKEDNFIERLLNKPKPFRDFIYENCSKCECDIIANYALGCYYYTCDNCGHFDGIEKINQNTQ